MNEHDVFLAALEIVDPGQRDAYLDQASAGNPALRKQVAALLVAHERSGDFLDVPAKEQLEQAKRTEKVGAETSAEPNERQEKLDLNFLQPSTLSGSLGRLGHYEIQEEVGQGGFGIVLKAFDEKLQRIVAIKVMAPELAATSPARKRFLREARATAQIRHENVVSIHAVEEQPLPYLVMEFIGGETLEQRLNRTGPLDVPDVLRIGQQIASGLAAAHDKGLIHRDIKPGNILLEDADRLKITDFGLARSADDASMTQSGTIVGTPLYMSPEQAKGREIDLRSDLFSLGSVLYVMCSGRPPFRAATTIAVLLRVVEEQPRPIQEIIPEVPAWLVAIIARLHAKDPAARFASARQVAQLLGLCLSEIERGAAVEALPQIRELLVEQAAASANAPAVEVAGLPDVQTPASSASTRAKQSASRPRHRGWLAAAAALLLAVLGLGLTEASGVTNLRGTIIRLFSPDGTLVVEVDDPSVSVSIDGEDMVITGAGIKEIRLKPGQHKVLARKDGKLLSQELVTVVRNSRRVVRVSKIAEPSMRADAEPATDPERRAAEWALSIGGSIEIRQANRLRQISKAGDLPGGEWELLGVNLLGKSQLTDAELARLQPCKSLAALELSRIPLTDAGLAHLNKLPYLNVLGLANTFVSDAGLAQLKPLPSLTELNLGNTAVTGAGLVNLKDKRLVKLNLMGAKLSDEGVDRLSELRTLVELILTGAAVTDARLARLTALEHLEGLHLAATEVSDAGMAHVATFKNLSSLGLASTRVTGAGLAQLTGLNKLAWLELNGIAITDADLLHLNGLSKLTVLNMSNVAITKAGLENLKDLALLEDITLINTRIDDASIEAIAAWTSLKRIRIQGTKFTAEGVKQLADRMPSCRITWDGGVIDPKH